MQFQKLSPGLVAALSDPLTPHVKRLDHRVGVMALRMDAIDAPEPVVEFFLRCEPGVPSERWAPIGVVASRHTRGLRTARAPLSSLDPLSEDSTVERLTAAQILHPRMDLASAATQLGVFVNKTHHDGAGVIVGVVDTGIDDTHPAFARRILSVWDQTVAGGGVAGFQYGVEHAQPTNGTSIDNEGHGTHVSSIAAGADPVYRGVAPGADLVVVRTSFSNTSIADGVDYIFGVADSLKRPAVVNLSLGGHNDAHDGTDELCAALLPLTGPGRIICVAAGNEGGTDIHARLSVAQGASTSVDVVVPPTPAVGLAIVNAWFSPHDTIVFSVRSPGGGSAQAVNTTPRPDGGYDTIFPLADGVVRILTPGPNPANGDLNVVVELLPPEGQASVTPGVWALTCEGKQIGVGAVDAWTVANPEVVHFAGSAVTHDMKVGSPGASPNAITLGAAVTRANWTDTAGNGWTNTGYSVGDLAPFSSAGPLRNGAPKPDLAAPGSMIIAGRSSQATFDPKTLIDASHVAMQGTSMATPFVTGLVALLLQADPTLDPNGARSAMQAASSIPASSSVGAAGWGSGAIDAGKL